MRVKSVTMLTLGEEGRTPGNRSGQAPRAEEDKAAVPGIPGLPDVGKALKGLFGF